MSSLARVRPPAMTMMTKCFYQERHYLCQISYVYFVEGVRQGWHISGIYPVRWPIDGFQQRWHIGYPIYRISVNIGFFLNIGYRIGYKLQAWKYRISDIDKFKNIGYRMSFHLTLK